MPGNYGGERRCSNTEPHMFHSFEEKAIDVCSGKTFCGEQPHKAHEIEQVKSFWCGGICNCSLRGDELHGPGAHK